MSDKNRIAFQTLPWLASLLAVLFIVWSGLAAPVGLWLKYDHTAVPLVIGVTAWAISRFCGSLRTAALIAFLTLTTTTVLFGTWQAGVTDGTYIAGLFPYSDAQGYFTDALRLLHGQKFTVFSSRRPLFALFLAGILGITGLDLRLTLCILTALAAVAIGFAAREVERSLGAIPGALALLCLFMFYRRYIGSTLTEQLGLTWGCIAFALIWRAAVEARPRLAVCGVFVLSLALNARAGAFFILPAIILWAAWVFRVPRGLSLRVGGGCIAAALLGFAINGCVLLWVGAPTAAFSNFSYTLYGLVFGGNWGSALQQHPELAALPPVDQANRIYTLAWERIRTTPLALLTGCVRAWASLFVGRSGTWASHFLYLSPEWSDVWVTLQGQGVLAVFRQLPLRLVLDVVAGMLWTIWLNVLLIAGLIVAGRSRRHPLSLLAAFGWAGIFLSAPFAPPWDADSMRAYAATLPFMVALPCLGVLYDAPDPAALYPGAMRRARLRMGDVLGLSLLLLILQIPVPLTLVMLAGSHGSSGGQGGICVGRCEGATERRALYIMPRAAVHVQESTEARPVHRWGNSVSRQSIPAWTHAYELPGVTYIWRRLSRMEGGVTLLSAYDLDRGSALYVQMSSVAFPQVSPQVVACGTTVLYGGVGWFQVSALTAYRPDRGREPAGPPAPKPEGTIR